MVDKPSTNKKRILTEHYPEQVHVAPIKTNGERKKLLQPNNKEEIIRRAYEGQSIRRISSELGMPYADVVRIIGGVS